MRNVGLVDSINTAVSKASNHAEGGTRTRTPRGATPSRWCVCQFHHFGEVDRTTSFPALLALPEQELVALAARQVPSVPQVRGLPEPVVDSVVWLLHE